MSGKEVKISIYQLIDSILLPERYVKEKTHEGIGYKKFREGGFIYVVPIFEDHDEYFYIGLSFEIRFDKVSEILVLLNNISDEFKEQYPTLTFGLNSLYEAHSDNKIKVENEKELGNTLEFFKRVLIDKWKELTDRLSSISDLDNEINRRGRQVDLFCSEVRIRPFVGLISAYLNNNPDIDFWSDYYKGFLENKNSRLKNKFVELEREILPQE